MQTLIELDQELVTMPTKTAVNIRVNEAWMVLPSLIVNYPIRDKKMPDIARHCNFIRSAYRIYFLAPGPLTANPLLM